MGHCYALRGLRCSQGSSNQRDNKRLVPSQTLGRSTPRTWRQRLAALAFLCSFKAFKRLSRRCRLSTSTSYGCRLLGTPSSPDHLAVEPYLSRSSIFVTFVAAARFCALVRSTSEAMSLSTAWFLPSEWPCVCLPSKCASRLPRVWQVVVNAHFRVINHQRAQTRSCFRAFDQSCEHVTLPASQNLETGLRFNLLTLCAPVPCPRVQIQELKHPLGPRSRAAVPD
jgi:hypothetical protein